MYESKWENKMTPGKSRTKSNHTGGGAGYNLRGVQGKMISDIGRSIVSGRFQANTPLPKEAELMETFGASRTSLREAIKVLAAKGLVESKQRVGTIVRPQSLWNAFDTDVITWHHTEGKTEKIFKDLIEVRMVIEPNAAKLAAVRAGFKDLKRIEDALKAMADAAQNPEEYVEADVDFHFAVIAASDNLLFTSFANVVGDFLRLSFELGQNASNKTDYRIEDDIAGHSKVFDAICRGESQAAFEAMLFVINDGKRSLIQALSQSDD